ncbi:protein-methionine-sulfoxide reductase heme-binding subunit MsrQ [Pseudoprimorskyibacter insulae]|uniref:Protein-methionine-sulfoxide reductase heme-binding subunit MsrQ n=1 Tax=Pseudoprimorskyibacter insulae TaxID=1695997 RepID=A0A2R8AYX6_9RHOB|nr:protein-methionine-sulfoxide reductase heme-binding subunit MsrQ [Pseudoprimorskyibacter insulae]SPF81246.1 Protein-methionine-sulfoxide reductase heme-binding subunit MsrQ [Pseudoprimorskyibacter insulae]
MGVVDWVNKAIRRIPVWLIYAGLMVPAGWDFWRAINGQLGVDPVKALEHSYGLWALWLLIAGLLVTPLRRFAGLNLLRLRRSIGLMAFFYVVAHLMVWAILDVQQLSAIVADILKRPYITIGMVGFALLVPLAVTSNDWSVRRMGRSWRRLHKLVYPAAVLGGVHYVMLVKGWQQEPLIYLAAIFAILGLRALPKARATPSRQPA